MRYAIILGVFLAFGFSQEKPKDKPKVLTSSVESPYIKLTLEEIDTELNNIEALREQYIAALNMLEGQKQFLLKLKADSTKIIKETP